MGLIAFGGLATGWAAIGGIAVGWHAFGAVVTGKHVIGIGRSDPGAMQFFGPWLENLVLRLGEWFTVIMLLSFAAAILVALRGKIKAITWRARPNGERTR